MNQLLDKTLQKQIMHSLIRLPTEKLDFNLIASILSQDQNGRSNGLKVGDLES